MGVKVSEGMLEVAGAGGRRRLICMDPELVRRIRPMHVKKLNMLLEFLSTIPLLDTSKWTKQFLLLLLKLLFTHAPCSTWLKL